MYVTYFFLSSWTIGNILKDLALISFDFFFFKVCFTICLTFWSKRCGHVTRFSPEKYEQKCLWSHRDHADEDNAQGMVCQKDGRKLCPQITMEHSCPPIWIPFLRAIIWKINKVLFKPLYFGSSFFFFYWEVGS